MYIKLTLKIKVPFLSSVFIQEERIVIGGGRKLGGLFWRRARVLE